MHDCRITQIYEGTNGIQALDLMVRKIVGSGGAYAKLFTDEIRAFTASASAELAEFTGPLNAAVQNLDELTAWVLDRAKGNPNEIGAASVEYLHAFGYTAYAYMWALMARASLGRVLRQQARHRALLLRPPAAAHPLPDRLGEGRQRVAVPAGRRAVLRANSRFRK